MIQVPYVIDIALLDDGGAGWQPLPQPSAHDLKLPRLDVGAQLLDDALGPLHPDAAQVVDEPPRGLVREGDAGGGGRALDRLAGGVEAEQVEPVPVSILGGHNVQ